MRKTFLCIEAVALPTEFVTELIPHFSEIGKSEIIDYLARRKNTLSLASSKYLFRVEKKPENLGNRRGLEITNRHLSVNKLMLTDLSVFQHY
jgi:hypothetical protein